MVDSTETKRAYTPRDNQEDTQLSFCDRWHDHAFGIFQKDDGSAEWCRGAKWYMNRRDSDTPDRSGVSTTRRDKGDGISGTRVLTEHGGHIQMHKGRRCYYIGLIRKWCKRVINFGRRTQGERRGRNAK